jgi:hypothetical protein
VEVHAFGGHERKSGLEVEARLVAERAERADPGAIGLGLPGLENMAQELKVLIHARFLYRSRSARRIARTRDCATEEI